MSRRSGSYPKELRERAVRLVEEVRSDHASEWAAMESVASNLGVGSAQTIHNWVRKAEVDAGTRPGTPSVESAELRKLRSEDRELRRANEILKVASAFFAAELDRPQR
jgi:transposase